MRILILLALMLAVAANRAAAEPAMADGIAVVVNEVVITYRDVEASLGPAVELLSRQYEKEPAVFQKKVTELQRERIEELVERQLILFDFTNSGYNLPESIIEDSVQERIREDYRDRVTLTKTLRAQGVTYETFKRNIRENIVVGALRDKHINQALIISPQKIEAYYQTNQSKFQMEDQVHLRMIVLNKSKDDPSTATTLAKEILKKIEEGASFAEMAGVYSEGSQKGQGGDWGWVDRSVLRKDLVDTAFSLKPGQHSGVIDTAEACYIMLAEDIRGSHLKPMAEVRADIEKTLMAQEQARLQKQWIERLKKKAYIRYY